jgi:hypothetical protein
MSLIRVPPEDRDAIVEVLHQYFWLIDHGRAAETAHLFTSSAELTFAVGAPKPGTLRGQEISAAMVARGKQTNVTTRHVISNIALMGRPDRTVAAYCLLTLFRSDSEARDSYPASVADIEDIMVRQEDGWRIKTRLISPIFNRPPMS